ncbi:hypothetical protein BCY86_06400 [Pajaroellobacter abortibovis]|uniref:Aminotransferase class IV n=1 Tax=Pajaroellobacter abortibovis TaxID=1882918 RepID=A0A1L6MZE3_9BACT|nr:hypothetical protein BCY86_06400 [Pajaroellobacter abortibovis]
MVDGSPSGVTPLSSFQVFVWNEERGLVPTVATESDLKVADSWLVSDGYVYGLALHKLRFFQACRHIIQGIHPPLELELFWQAVLEKLPRQGRWFPRVELAWKSNLQLFLRLRPAPSVQETARVWIENHFDPRRTPRRKGPDLTSLAELRHRAMTKGANEALLVTPSGIVQETSSSSILWWKGDTLCTPSPSLRILPSITVNLIQQMAYEMGVHTVFRKTPLSELEGLEVWLANSLHGIRPVVQWVGNSPSITAGPVQKAPLWQRMLHARAQLL